MRDSVEKKRQYIEATYHIIQKQGILQIRIRKLVLMIGRTSVVLYRHFENVDHLITLASIRFLKGYMKAFQQTIDSRSRNPIQHSQDLWKLFTQESFKYPEIYEFLFFGKYTEQLGDFIYEYFQIFPEELIEMDGYTVSILLEGDLETRELILLRTAANKGMITLDEAKLISRVEMMIYQGYLYKCRNLDAEEVEKRKIAQECYETIHAIVCKYAGKYTK